MPVSVRIPVRYGSSRAAQPATDDEQTLRVRCDACGVRAYVVMSDDADPAVVLAFCAHHFALHESALRAAGWSVEIDERALLNNTGVPS
jgi:hypothetical protein